MERQPAEEGYRDDVSRCCELEGGSREEGSSGSTKVDVPSSYPDQGRTGRGHEELPAKERSIVEDAMKTDLGLDEPREFQVRACHEGSFKDGSVMHVWAKTGSGKSAIPLTISTLRRGISLVMVPLLGLGSDLGDKSHGAGTNIESYHVDEHHGEDATMLKRRLSSYDKEEAEDVSIILFISPLFISLIQTSYHLSLPGVTAKIATNQRCRRSRPPLPSRRRPLPPQ